MDAAKVFVDVIIPGKQGSNKAMNDLIDDATNMQIDLYKSYGVIAGQSNTFLVTPSPFPPLYKLSVILKLIFTELTPDAPFPLPPE